MDRELLEKHSEGIIVLSGCPSGELHRLILDGRMRGREGDGATGTASIFDGHYYFEVQEHDLPEFTQTQRVLIELSKEMGIPLVATNDSHYLDARRPRQPGHPPLHRHQRHGARREADEDVATPLTT